MAMPVSWVSQLFCSELACNKQPNSAIRNIREPRPTCQTAQYTPPGANAMSKTDLAHEATLIQEAHHTNFVVNSIEDPGAVVVDSKFPTVEKCRVWERHTLSYCVLSWRPAYSPPQFCRNRSSHHWKSTKAWENSPISYPEVPHGISRTVSVCKVIWMFVNVVRRGIIIWKPGCETVSSSFPPT